MDRAGGNCPGPVLLRLERLQETDADQAAAQVLACRRSAETPRQFGRPEGIGWYCAGKGVFPVIRKRQADGAGGREMIIQPEIQRTLRWRREIVGLPPPDPARQKTL